jgi:hypothetical protein
MNQKRETLSQIRQVNFVIKINMSLMSGSLQGPLEAKLSGNVSYQLERLSFLQLSMICSLMQ